MNALSLLAKQVVYNTLNHVQQLFRPSDGKVKEIMEGVNRKGYHVVEGYWSPDQCAKAIAMIDSLLAAPTTKIQVLEGGVDNRIFGADRLKSELDLSSDPFIKSVLQGLYGSSGFVGFTLAAKLVALGTANKGSGGGWHRDSAIKPQFKAIMYLTDVTQETGPFQYLTGSHQLSESFKTYKSGIARVGQYRFEEEDIRRLQGQHGCDLQTFCAKAGSVIFANTHGIHRGKPIAAERRYALTTYAFKNKISEDFAKQLN